MLKDKARIVIVGGGIIGSSVAYSLAANGEVDITVLEMEKFYDQHSTGRSAAYYIPMYESVSFGVLAKASIEFLTNPPVGFSDTEIFRRDGAVIAAIPGKEASVTNEIEDAQGLGLEVTLLNGRQINNLVPVVRTDKIQVAAYYADAGEIDVTALARGYRNAAEKMGVRFVLGRVYKGARVENEKIKAALTDQGEIICDVIVNAAGAWVGEVAALSGAMEIKPLVLRRHLLKAPIKNVSQHARWPFFRCPSLPLYFKLTDGELTFSPMDAEPTPVGPCDLSNEKVAQTLKILSDYTELKVDPNEVKALAGHRIFGSDHQPLIGRDPKLSSFFWAAGMGGAGIMAAPAVGSMLSAAILGTPSEIDASSSSLERFIAGKVGAH